MCLGYPKPFFLPGNKPNKDVLSFAGLQEKVVKVAGQTVLQGSGEFDPEVLYDSGAISNFGD